MFKFAVPLKQYQPKMKIKKNTRANLTYQVITHLILIALIFAVFFLAATSRVHSKVVKQQVLEKQTALLIDSAVQGMVFTINKVNKNGRISNLEIKEGRVFVYVEGQGYSKGYPYFSKYEVILEKEEGKFLIKIE